MDDCLKCTVCIACLEVTKKKKQLVIWLHELVFFGVLRKFWCFKKVQKLTL